MSRRLRTLFITVPTVFALVLVGFAPYARAESPAGDPPGQLELVQQGRLIEFFGWLVEQGFEERGYVAPEQEANASGAILRWKNIAAIDREAVLVEADGRGITVGFKEAPFSLSELEALAEQAFNMAPMEPASR